MVHRVVRRFRRARASLPGLLRPPDRAAVRQRFGLERTLRDGAVTEISTLAPELGMIPGRLPPDDEGAPGRADGLPDDVGERRRLRSCPSRAR
jgi:hypothetical protein